MTCFFAIMRTKKQIYDFMQLLESYEFCKLCETDKTNEFIKKAKIKHGDTYSYENTIYVNSKTKVMITCLTHGDFEQNPSNHSNGQGCPQCIGRNKTPEQFIEQSQRVHGNKYNYDKTIYCDVKTKVTITCQQHGDFEQLPSNHLKGSGCLECGGKLQKTTEQFIKQSQNVHDNKYTYEKTNYVNDKTKVIITCSQHGDFLQTPSNHLRYGCNKCATIVRAKKTKKTFNQFIKKAQSVHNNEYTYEKTNYINSKTKVIINCKIHGGFEQTPDSHLHGNGCEKCAIIVRAKKLTKTTEQFIKEAQFVHENKYNYEKTNCINSKIKVIITCKIHGDFEQTFSSHLQGTGCPDCYGKFTKTTEKFIEEAQKVHNNKYTYENINYVNAKTKITITCKIHGIFEQRPNCHLRGKGCEKCSKIVVANKLKKTTEQFIEEAQKVHNNKYTYEKTIYKNAKTKAIITCPQHGDFLQTTECHLNGNGCEKCAIIFSANKRRKTTEQFIKEAQIVHNNKYTYEKTIYIGDKTRVIIKCPKHGYFEQRPSNHLRGCGCPRCGKNHSKMQIEWLNFVSKQRNENIQHMENGGEFLIPNSKFKADGFCEETNTVYEFHGDYWHGNPKIFNENEMNLTTKTTFGELYKKTKEKEEFIKQQGFNLVTIYENDWLCAIKTVKKLQRLFRIFVTSKKQHVT